MKKNILRFHKGFIFKHFRKNVNFLKILIIFHPFMIKDWLGWYSSHHIADILNEYSDFCL